MTVSSEFDEKEFWLELFSIVARRETGSEDEISSRTMVLEKAIEPEGRPDSPEQICATIPDAMAVE
jgi:hypothetical protein